MTLDTSDAIDTIYGRFLRASKRRLDLTYDYEHLQICVFRRLAALVEPTRMLDIGANIGVYGVYVSDVASLRQVHLFEPAVETFELLAANVALQSVNAECHVHSVALSDAKGTADFHVHGELAGNNAIASTDQSRRSAGSVVQVELERLDGLLGEVGDERFIAKIDVEGHEAAVIKGGAEYFAGNRGVVQIESFDQGTESTVAAMQELGYRRFAWLKHDHLFSNLGDDAEASLLDIVFDELQSELMSLQEHKRLRRTAIRSARATLDSVKYGTDPVRG